MVFRNIYSFNFRVNAEKSNHSIRQDATNDTVQQRGNTRVRIQMIDCHLEQGSDELNLQDQRV